LIEYNPQASGEASVTSDPSPRGLVLVACQSSVGLQLPIDDVVYERHIIHDREMGAFADVDLQT
jgi:hypothetical protein